MANRIITNRSSLAGSAARDAESRRSGQVDSAHGNSTAPLRNGGSMGFSMRGQGGRTTSLPARAMAQQAVAETQNSSSRHDETVAAAFPASIQQAAYPAHAQDSGEVTSVAARFKQMFRNWFQ